MTPEEQITKPVRAAMLHNLAKSVSSGRFMILMSCMMVFVPMVFAALYVVLFRSGTTSDTALKTCDAILSFATTTISMMVGYYIRGGAADKEG